MGEDYSPLIVKSLLAKQLLPQVIKARQLVFIYIYIYESSSIMVIIVCHEEVSFLELVSKVLY
jgi:hypothetical protein